MQHHIKHSEDVLRVIQQDIERDRLAHIARHGDDLNDAEIFEGHSKSVAKGGPLNVAMAFSIVALGTLAAAIMLRAM